MSLPLVQVAILVVLTNVVRAVGDRLGPRWGALALGMPSTTAVLLVGGGWEWGAAESARAAGIGLLGLVGAVTLPLAYAWTALRGWGMPAAPIAGVAGYVAVAVALHQSPDLGAAGPLAVALLGVALGCALARRLPEPCRASAGISPSRSLAVRAAVPAAFVVGLRGVGALAGPDWAGLFATFPAMSLAVLVTLHLEGGPASACRFARSMPRGNLGTAAFLAAFRLSCGDLGPILAAALGYAAALVVVAGLARREPPAVAGLRIVGHPGAGEASRPARTRRRFAPGFEPIAA